MNGKLKIKDGKFWRDGQLVPMEIGNKEQIELLQWTQSLIEELAKEGIMPNFISEDPKIDTIQFKCPCGECVEANVNDDDNWQLSCDNCKRNFEYMIDEDDIPIIKSRK